MVSTPERKLAAIMVADIAGFSTLMERDETSTFERVKDLRENLCVPKIAEHHGRIIKTTGDGFLAEFPSATAALQCAISLQRHNYAREELRPAADRIHLRIGINVGDVIIDGTDVAGDGVVIAARLEPLAPLDGICVSATVREHIRQELGIEYEDLGDQHVRNISRPIRAYRIVIGGKDSVDTKGARVFMPARKRVPKRIFAGVILLVVLAIATGVAMNAGFLPFKTSPSTAAKAQHMTFAVVPLSAPEGDAQTAAFASSVTDGVIARQVNSIWNRVVARESVEAILKQHASPRELSRALNVRYVIRGRVGRNGDKFDVNLAVIDGETERVLGSKDFQWPASLPFDPERAVFSGTIGGLSGQANVGERELAGQKRDEDLDVRELAYRARDEWNNTREGYEKAMSYLRRAQAKDPNDRAVLFMLAQVNLCECRAKWSSNPAEQEKIGEEAVDRYLARHPANRAMVLWKVYLLSIRGRHEDALVVVEGLLDKSPSDPELLAEKAYHLVKAGRPKEALPAALASLSEDNSLRNRLLGSSVHFILKNYSESETLAQKAIAELSKDDRRDASIATVFLIRAAANANLGRLTQARSALDDFSASIPDVKSISQMRNWMDPRAGIAGHEPLYDGLRKAGLPD